MLTKTHWQRHYEEFPSSQLPPSNHSSRGLRRERHGTRRIDRLFQCSERCRREEGRGVDERTPRRVQHDLATSRVRRFVTSKQGKRIHLVVNGLRVSVNHLGDRSEMRGMSAPGSPFDGDERRC